MYKKILFLTIVFLLLVSFASGALTDDDTWYYSYDNTNVSGDNPIDLSGNGNDGTGVGTPTTGQVGILGESFLYDGATDAVSAPYVFQPNDMTYIAWFKTSTTGLGAIFAAKTVTNRKVSFFVDEYAGDELSFAVSDGSSSTVARVASIDFHDGAWHHIVATYRDSDNEIEIWYDGVNQTLNYQSQNSLSLDVAFGQDLLIGAYNNKGAAAFHFTGYVDESSTYDRVITNAEIAQSWNGGSGFNPYAGVPPVVVFNDSTESTAVDKQIGTVSFTGLSATILSSTFNVTINNTPLYLGYSFNVETASSNVLFCDILVDGVSWANVTRSNDPGEVGSVFIQTDVLILSNSTSHTQSLVCQRLSGGGSITVGEAVGVGHLLVDADNNFLNNNRTSFSTGVSSGSGFTLLDRFNISSGVKNSSDRCNHIVVEGSLVYFNLDAGTEILGTYLAVDGVNCTSYPRTVSASGSGSVAVDCVLDNVTSNTTFQVELYGNGTNSVYEGNVVAKNFFFEPSEIAGGNSSAVGLSFAGATDVKLFNGTIGNLNFAGANAFEKLSYSIFTTTNTEVNFYLRIVNGSTTYTGKNFTRTFQAGVIGVLTGHDVLQNITPDPAYQFELWANCGDVLGNCTIVGGSALAYFTDITDVFSNSFNVTVSSVVDNSTIFSFNITNSFGDTFSTVSGVVNVFSNLSSEDYVVRSFDNGTNYFGRSIFNHDTAVNLNVTMYPGIINLTSPVNNTIFNSMPDFKFIFSNGVWKGLTCFYYDNRTGAFSVQDTKNNVGAGVETTFSGVAAFPSDGSYAWYVTCENDEYVSETRLVIYDVTVPVIFSAVPSESNNSFFNTNFSLNITVTDPNNFDSLVNITDKNGDQVFYRTYNTSGFPEFFIGDLINLSVPGLHTLFVESADGHTSNRIGAMSKNNIPDGVKFNKELRIYGLNDDYVVSTVKKFDRYSLDFVREDESWLEGAYEFVLGHKTVPKLVDDPDSFVVSIAGGDIDIISDSDYAGHMIVKVGSDYNDWYWVDFENSQSADVVLSRIDSSSVQVDVYGSGDYSFNSVGRLNVVNKSIEFYYDTSDISLVATYESDLVTGFPTVYNLAATLNPLTYDLNETKTVTIDIGGDLFSAFSNGSSINTFFYYYPFVVPSDYAFSTLTHQWYFETIDKTNATVQTTTGPLVQNVFQVLIGSCNASLQYTLINFSYFDEADGGVISTDMNYVLEFFDGVFTYPASGFFTGDTTNAICTNLNPVNVSYGFEVTGLVTVSNVAANYTTRVFTFSPGDPLVASNTVPLFQDLYLVKLSDSQTVEYTWLSSSYELIDGVMRIYRCFSNNSVEMVESALITGGSSSANIELLTASYSYDVIVGGVVYRDESYNVCHIETSQSVTYYVTLTPEQLTPVSGLLFTQCSITGPDNASVVTMTWSDNNYDSSSITACLQGLREAAGNYIQVFEDCSIADTGTLSVIVPANNNEYIVRGFLTQGNNSGYCTDVIKIGDDANSGDVLGMTGLWAIILFVLAIALYYSDNSEVAVFGSALAVIFSWIIGFTAFGWFTTVSIATYLLIIVFISRGRKRK